MPTVCIRIVADCGTRFFQVTIKFYAGYNVHIYCYFGYYFYTLLAIVYSFTITKTRSVILKAVVIFDKFVYNLPFAPE